MSMLSREQMDWDFEQAVNQAYLADTQPLRDEKAREEDPGWWDRAWGALTSMREEAAADPSKPYRDTGAPLAYGVFEGIDQTVSGIVNGTRAVQQWTRARNPDQPAPIAIPEPRDLTDLAGLDAPTTAGGQIAAALGQLTAGVAASYVPGAGAGAAAGALRGIGAGVKAVAGAKGAKAVEKAGDVLGGAELNARFALADALAFDPEEGGLLSLLNEVPALDPVIHDWIAARDPNDPEWVNRSRNAIEGAMLGAGVGITTAMLGQVVGVVQRSVARLRSGNPASGPDTPASVAVKREANEQSVAAQQTIEERVHEAGLEYTEEETEALAALDARIAEGEAAIPPQPEAAPRSEEAQALAGLQERLTSLRAANVPDDMMEVQEARLINEITAARKALPEDEQARMVEEAKAQEAWRNEAWSRQALLKDLQARRRKVADAPLERRRKEVAARAKEAEALEARRAEMRAMEEQVQADADEVAELRDAYKRGGEVSDEDAEFLTDWQMQARKRVVEQYGDEAGPIFDRNVAGERVEDPVAREVEFFTGAEGFATYTRITEGSENPEMLMKVAANVRNTLRAADASLLSRGQGDLGLEELEAPMFKALRAWEASPADEESAAIARGLLMQYLPRARSALPGGTSVHEPSPIRFATRAEFEAWETRLTANLGRIDPQLTRDIDPTPTAPVKLRVEARLPVDEETGELVTGMAGAKGLEIAPITRKADADVGGYAPEDSLRIVGGRIIDPELDVDLLALQADTDFTELVAAAGAVRTQVEEGQVAIEAITPDQLAAVRAKAASPEGVRAAQDRLYSFLSQDYGIEVAGRMRIGYRLRKDIDARAALALLEGGVDTVRRLAAEAGKEGASAQMRADVLRAMHKLEGLAMWTLGRDGNARKAFQRAALPVAEDADGAVRRSLLRRELIAKSGGSVKVDEYMKALGDAKPGREATGLLQQWRRASDTAWSAWNRTGMHRAMPTIVEMMLNNRLSAMGSWGRNLAGNAVFGSMRIAEDFLNDAMDPNVTLSEAGHLAYAQMEEMATSLHEGFLLAKDDALFQTWAGKNPDDVAEMGHSIANRAMDRIRNRRPNMEAIYEDFKKSDKFDYNQRVRRFGMPQVVSDTLRLNEGKIAQVFRAVPVDALQTLPTAMMQSGDILTKYVNYRGFVRREAMRQARKEGLDGEAFNERMAKLMDRPEHMDAGDEATRIHSEAMQYAHETAFTDDPTFKGTQGLIELRRQYPAAALFVPFVRTLDRITTQALKRTPGVGLIGRTKEVGLDTRAGREIVSQQVMGLMIYGTAATLALEGKITGSAAGTPEQRRALQRTGWRERSFVIEQDDGTPLYVPYEFLPVIGPMFGTAADLMQAFSAAEGESDVQEAFDALDAFVEGFGNYNSGFWGEAALDTLRAHTSGNADHFLRHWGGVAEAVATPWHAQLRRLAAMDEDMLRRDFRASGGIGGEEETWAEKIGEEARTRVDALLSRIPGVSETGIPRRSIFTGEPLRMNVPNAPKEVGLGALANAAFGPAAFSYGDSHPDFPALVPEFHRLAPGLSYPKRTLSVSIGKNLPTGMLELTPQETDYVQEHHYRTFGARMGHRMQLKRYQNASDRARRAQWQEIWNSSRQQAVQLLRASQVAQSGPEPLAVREQALGAILRRQGMAEQRR